MLYRKDGEWHLAPLKVKYKQHGETLEQYTNSKKWWEDFAKKWDHTKIIEFKDVTYSEEQLGRLNEIQEIGRAHV